MPSRRVLQIRASEAASEAALEAALEAASEAALVICGIDPGFAIVGYGFLRHEGGSLLPVEFGCVRTDAEAPFALRLLTIHDSLAELILRLSPEAVAVETLLFNKNAKTAIEVAQGRGAALLAAARLGVEVAEYSPPQVKMAVTGYGRADKPQMQRMVKTILGLPAVPKPDDVADALAVAICHAHSFKLRGLACQ